MKRQALHVLALIGSLTFVVTLVPAAALAQIAIPGLAPDLSISADPQSPGAGQAVTLSLQSSLLDLSNTDITWSIDGAVATEGVGKTQFVVTAGALGHASTVSVSASAAGQTAQASATIVPESVDLLFNASSYVPPFYRGRALPSPGSSLRVQAIPHILTASGEADPGSLIYTWSQDGDVLGSLSGAGRSSATLQAPPLFGSSVVEVDVRTADGAYSASASARIPAVDPTVTLYQDNPLFGIEFFNALPDQASVSDTETTFAAVAYFAPIVSPDEADLSYAWRVNGVALPSATSSASEITLDATGASGPATLSLSLMSPADLYLDAEHTWTISFGAQPGFAPAAPAPAQDAFHAQ